MAYCEPCFEEKTLEYSDGGKIEQHEKQDGPDRSKEPKKYVLKL